MDILVPIIIVIAVIVLLILLRGKLKNSNKINEKELLNKCFGDSGRVERLINFELNRNPKLTREDAARNASNSITRDNR